MKCGWRNSRFFSFIWRYLNLAHYRFQDLDSKRFLARANPEIGLLKHIFKVFKWFWIPRSMYSPNIQSRPFLSPRIYLYPQTLSFSQPKTIL